MHHDDVILYVGNCSMICAEKHGITNKVQTKLQKLNLVVTQSRLLIFNIPKMVTQIMNVTNPQLPGDAGLDQSKFDVTNEKAKISLDDQDISNIYSVPLSEIDLKNRTIKIISPYYINSLLDKALSPQEIQQQVPQKIIIIQHKEKRTTDCLCFF